MESDNCNWARRDITGFMPKPPMGTIAGFTRAVVQNNTALGPKNSTKLPRSFLEDRHGSFFWLRTPDFELKTERILVDLPFNVNYLM